MKNLRAFSIVLAASLLFAGAAGLRAEEKSLLATDGTLYSVRSGLAADLGVSAPGIRPTDNLIEWTSVAQDGKHALGIIPNTVSANTKTNLDLAFDSQSASLVLLWKEELSVLNVLHLGLFKGGTWKSLDLLPSLGFAHAYNPQMLLSHQTIHMLDEAGKDGWKTRSILSVIWWEESHVVQARYAPIFLDEDTSASDVAVYDLPKMVGSDGSEGYGDVSPATYVYPSLQLEGPGGGVLATFTDLAKNRDFVVRVNYPSDLGAVNSKSWLRRRIPVFGVALDAPLPIFGGNGMMSAVSTVIGPAYNPTLVWSEDAAVKFLRYDSATGKWGEVRSIPLGDDMSKDRALALVRDMASKN
jgi:hypothetical protein